MSQGDAELLELAAARALAAVDSRACTAAALVAQPIRDDARRVVIVALGKAAAGMGAALAEAAGPRLAGGVVVSAAPASRLPAPSLEYLLGDHPFPGLRSLAAGRRIAALLHPLGAADHVLVGVSGGASALVVLPDEDHGVTLEVLAARTRELMAAGADIATLNAARGQLDLLKQGGLARLAAPATVAAFVLGDTPGHPPTTVGSGPVLVPAPTVVADNSTAVRAAAAALTERGLRVRVSTDPLVGRARVAGPEWVRACLEDPGDADAFVVGGETTVQVVGPGRGGRLCELTLASLPILAEHSNAALLALATDGRDGPSGTMGAMLTTAHARAALASALDVPSILAMNDSASALATLGVTLPERATGTNVADVLVLLRAARP